MSFYSERVLPHIIDLACGMEAIAHQREQVVPLARGTVLEVGMGPGHNLAYYDPDAVERVIGLEPSVRSVAMARERALQVAFPVEFLTLRGEEIPLETASVDTVLLTYTLCTIPDPARALAQMRRVLKPSGQLVFAEHGRAPDAQVVRWQGRLNGLWKVLFGGCNLDRDIPGLIRSAGFQVGELTTLYLPKSPRFAGFNYRGWAAPETEPVSSA